MAENESLNLQTGDSAIPRVKFSETGYLGLKEFDGIILEESRKALVWPRANRTFQEMSQDATIASALSLFEMMISRVKWSVVPPKDATEEELKQVRYLEQCMNDMDHSWFTFIKEVTSMFTYGYCVNEKVYRRRKREFGSRYDDGLVGIKKMPVRSQTTVKEWKFSDDGRDLLAVIQDTSLLNDGFRLANSQEFAGEIEIPRKKFLLFRTDVSRDNPQGRSPLAKVWTAWKYRKQIEESEAVGITRGLGGIPDFRLPAKFMSPDATTEEKAVYEEVKRIGRNLQNNEQSCVVFPSLYDDQGKPLFDWKLVGPPNASQYDTDKAIIRWDNKILQALFADILQMGNSKGGSFNLADSKSSIMQMAVESRLREIQDPLNNDLVPQLWSLNGWKLDRLPTFEFAQVKEEDLDIISKYLQRAGSQGLIQKTPENINKIAEWVGLPDRINSDEELDSYQSTLTGFTSNAGEGMEEGMPSGTGSADGSSGDSSSRNSENT